MSKKQTPLESFFEKRERPNDETAEDSKTANKKKAAFKRKYQEFYLNYGFIATGDSHSPSTLHSKTRLWRFSKEKSMNTKNRSNY